jgi:hypothetical protein
MRVSFFVPASKHRRRGETGELREGAIWGRESQKAPMWACLGPLNAFTRFFFCIDNDDPKHL